MSTTTPSTDSGALTLVGEPVTTWRSCYTLGLLFVVYIFNFIDRSIINILSIPIKAELGLMDWQIGMLGAGLPFAIFYTFMGIPIARLADTSNRRNIIAVSLTVWSGFTAVCGLAQNFWHLLLARVGVAVGEAGGGPPSHAMIADLFASRWRATALGLYALGIPVGTMLGNLMGGWLNEAMDWRMAFVVVGLPGVALALVLRYTVQEPPRTVSMASVAARRDAPPVRDVFRALWTRRSFRYMSLGAGFHALVGYGVGPFQPLYFSEVHGLTTREIGDALFLLGFAGILGTASGGYFADRLGVRDKRWYVWLPGIATLVSVPFATASYLWPDAWSALWLLALPGFLGAYYLGPTFSLTQGLVGPRMRAVAASILLFVLNLIGMGLGPVFVGATSDVLRAYTDLGAESVRWALVSVLVFNVLSTFFYLLAARHLRGDLARAHELE